MLKTDAASGRYSDCLLTMQYSDIVQVMTESSQSQVRRRRPEVVFVEHVPPSLLPSDPNMYWRLSADEEQLIAHLTEAYTATQTGQTYIKLSRTSSLCCDQVRSILRQMAVGMVQFFTTVPDFCALPPVDQAASLSFNAMPLFLLRNAFAASCDFAETDTIRVVTSSDHMTHHDMLVQHLIEFQKSLGPVLRNDVATAALLQCYVVFDARAPDVWDRQGINQMQDKYIILMKHYLESQCSYLFSWQYSEQMNTLVKQSRTLGVMVTQMCKDWKNIIDPLTDQLSKSDHDDRR